MEIQVTESKGKRIDKDNIRVKRKTLQALLDDCQRALELLNLDDEDRPGERSASPEEEPGRGEFPSSDRGDPEADQVCISLSLSLCLLRNCEEE